MGPACSGLPAGQGGESGRVSLRQAGKARLMSGSQEPVSNALRRLGSPPARPDPNGPSKQELYARAKELDIPRRSAMTKEELARAIARREG